MKIKKTIEVGLDIRDPIGLFADENNIMRVLVDKYEKRCYAECYILSIDRVVKTGDCIINKHGLPNYGTISVIFEVTAIVFGVGEIINGCVVKNKDLTGSIVCGTDICHVLLAPDPLMSAITEGQMISVRVGKAKYQIGSSRVSISAVPFALAPTTTFYKIAAEPARVQLLDDVRDRIKYEEAEMEKIKADNPKAWTTFEQLLYAYKKPQELDGRTLSLEELVTEFPNLTGFVGRDPRGNLATDFVSFYPDQGLLPQGSKVRTGDPTQVLILMFEDYCSFLRTIREMISIYSTEELLDKHLNLWKLYNKMKA